MWPTDTGRLYFVYFEEFAMNVAVTGCTLTGGKGGTQYWVQVTPEFGATGTLQLSYESNVPDTPPPNAFGPPEPIDQSFFYGPAFGSTSFTPAQQLGPLHVFSAGVEGSTPGPNHVPQPDSPGRYINTGKHYGRNFSDSF
jgi:hypothetical protein